jgi:hypothetical protein
MPGTWLLTDYARLPGFKGFWSDRKHWFSEDFQEFMDAEILAAKPSNDVPLPGDY